MRRVVFSVLGILLLSVGSLAQQIGVPWFIGWQGPFSGTTDAQGYFEIIVLRTSDATHAITGRAYDGTTRQPIAYASVAIRYYGGLRQGIRVEILVAGYQTEIAAIRKVLSSYNPARRPPIHKTYDVGTIYLYPSQRSPLGQPLPGVDFGQVPVGTTKTLDYEFRNTLGERITINAVGFGDRFYNQDPPSPTAAVFSISGVGVPRTLSPGETYRFRITFTPRRVGPHSPANPLTICVNTHLTNRHIHFQIPLSGTGTSGAGRTLTLHPIQDATICERYPSKNYGSEPYLMITPKYSGMVISGEDRVMIHFDLSGVPAGAQIKKATLRLCVREFQGDYLLVAVYPINRSWDEGTVTWDTHHDAYDYQTRISQTKLTGLSPGDWAEFDVTTSVRNAVAGATSYYGWMLIPVSTHYPRVTSVKFHSREAGRGLGPQLVIEFSPSPAIPIIDKTMCKDVKSSPPYDPIDRTSTFTTQDKQAVAWVKFGPLYSGHRVRFEWFYLDDPSGPRRVHVYLHDIPDPKRRGYTRWDWYVVWSSFPIRGTLYARLPRPSHWEVKIFVDGVYVDSLYFIIRG